MFSGWYCILFYFSKIAEAGATKALFWSCFGGVEMLRDFGLAEDLRSESTCWMQTLEPFVDCCVALILADLITHTHIYIYTICN